MRLRTHILACALLFGPMFPATAAAQNRAAARSSGKASSRLLAPDDGLAILSAALDSRHRPNAGPDCSHLVHSVYAKAGFPFAYRKSSDLYAGAPEFRRVQHPQPGDLIVWPGHAGIVVNPPQRTFFSALRTGSGVDAWDAAYWRHRGAPRFYRYLKPAPVLVASKPTPSLKAAGLHTIRSAELAPQPALDESADPAPAEDHAIETASVRSEISSEPSPNLPTAAIVHSVRPKASQVNAALLDLVSSNAQSLEAQYTVPPSQSLFIFDRIAVEKVSLKDHYGWADIRLAGPATIVGDTATVKKHTERQRWTLTRRDSSTWELILPANVVYLPRDAAARILAHELATLTDTESEQPADRARKIQLARLLSVLLEASAP